MKTIETNRPDTSAAAPRSTDHAVELEGLSRFFEHRPAVVRVDLRVRRGEILLVKGPNGAGKSTLLRVLSTALSPSEGEGRILGFDLRTQRRDIRQNVEYVGHQTRLYEDLTARENLRFVARLWGVPEPRIDEALAEVGLIVSADLRVSMYSQGMRQRLALARTVLRAPQLLLLDEPFAALDASARHALTAIVEDAMRREATVLIVSHDHYADSLATRRVDMTSGRIVRDADHRVEVAL